MTTKTFAIWMLACAVGSARPGDLDRNFKPELRAWVAPDHVTLAADGRAWVGGGFDRGDDYSTGDLVQLGEDGGVENEPAPGYLDQKPTLNYGSFLPDPLVPFHLAAGGFLLPGEGGGWLRMNAAGEEIGKAFADRQPGETVLPLFEREGKLWVIRRFVDGSRRLERRESADGQLDTRFSLAAANVNRAVPGTNGSVWVLTGNAQIWSFWVRYGMPLPEQRLTRVDAGGNSLGAPQIFAVPRLLDLVAGPAGTFRLAYGADQSRLGFWPSATTQSLKIEWYSSTGVLGRAKEFHLGQYETFAWAEGADGSLVAMDGTVRIPGGSHFYIAKTASLRRYGPDGVEDPTFISPGSVRSVKALADGKWLVDGLRRLNADGSEDTSWTAPQLDAPAQVTALVSMGDGRVLGGGNFATVDGMVSNRMIVFRANGDVDPSFIADDRIGEWRSVAVAGQAIYVVTAEPVAYGNAVRSNLVKLGPDGALDESYEPLVPVNSWTAGARFQTVDNVRRITGLAGGDLLVETAALGGDIQIHNLARLKPDGTRNATFRGVKEHRGFTRVLALAKGGFAGDAVIYRADGTVERDLSEPGSWLAPICESSGGVLFQAGVGWTATRMKLWTGRGFAPWFQAPTLDWNKGVTAVRGEFGMFYLAAALVGERATIHRLLPNGRLDRSFRSPRFTFPERREAGDWWKVGESGRIALDPARHESECGPQSFLWHPASRRLWTGGNFTVVDGQPRDGLARITGGFSRWPWR